MKIELSKAINYKDKELTEIELEIEKLTGYQLLEAEEDLRRQGITINAWDYSKPYMIQLASRASKIPVEVLKGLSANDFIKVCNVVTGFLLGVGTEELTRIGTEKR